jgi:RnfABCDGE-type electron transport complex B subunit
MVRTILVSILSMAGLGLVFASVLAFVHQKLKVKEDPKVEKIEKAFPGLNCGACGFANCRRYAEALAKGEVSPNECKTGGEDVINRLSGILNVEIEKKPDRVAVVHCGADETKRKRKATYAGIKTCFAAHNTLGGEVLCEYGCLGYGDCKGACPFGAITMLKGLPVVDKGKCTACGKCVVACPRSLITLEKIDSGNLTYVACSNPDKGPATRKACSVGCIACGICQKLTGGIFHVENNLALVKYDNAKNIANIEEVINKCPTKCILKA